MDFTINGNLDDDRFAFLNVYVFNTETFDVCKDVTAIIDTGAQDCLVKRRLAKKMGLKSAGKLQELNPVGGTLECDYFIIGLVTDTANPLDAEKYVKLQVGILEEESFPSDIILGGTFLRHCTFLYNGRGKIFELHIQL